MKGHLMFKKTPSPEVIALDEAIAGVLSDMRGFNSDAEEYDAMSDQLVKLMKLKKEYAPNFFVSPDVLAGVAGNLAGILLILNFERANVIASKALSFVMKLR